MILKEKILFSKEECESIVSYNNTHITNWMMGDRKYNSQPIDYSLETIWLFNKLKTPINSKLPPEYDIVTIYVRHIAYIQWHIKTNG